MAENIIKRLINAKIITQADIDEYNKQRANDLINQNIEEHIYSKIEDGVLIKFDERDLDKYGNYTTPDIVTKIKKYAFSKANAATITLGESVRYLEDYALWDCKAKKIVVKGNVKKIGKYAFHLCLDLKEIELPDSLEEISQSMLDNCISLKEIKLPKNLKHIRSYAFARCTSLIRISDLPESLQSIGLSVCVHTPVEHKFNNMVKNLDCTVEKIYY